MNKQPKRLTSNNITENAIALLSFTVFVSQDLDLKQFWISHEKPYNLPLQIVTLNNVLKIVRWVDCDGNRIVRHPLFETCHPPTPSILFVTVYTFIYLFFGQVWGVGSVGTCQRGRPISTSDK